MSKENRVYDTKQIQSISFINCLAKKRIHNVSMMAKDKFSEHFGFLNEFLVLLFSHQPHIGVMSVGRLGNRSTPLRMYLLVVILSLNRRNLKSARL